MADTPCVVSQPSPVKELHVSTDEGPSIPTHFERPDAPTVDPKAQVLQAQQQRASESAGSFGGRPMSGESGYRSSLASSSGSSVDMSNDENNDDLQSSDDGDAEESPERDDQRVRFVIVKGDSDDEDVVRLNRSADSSDTLGNTVGRRSSAVDAAAELEYSKMVLEVEMKRRRSSRLQSLRKQSLGGEDGQGSFYHGLPPPQRKRSVSNNSGNVKRKRKKNKKNGSLPAMVDATRLQASSSPNLPRLKSDASVPFIAPGGMSIQRHHLLQRFPWHKERLRSPTQDDPSTLNAYELSHQRTCKLCGSTGLTDWGNRWSRLFDREHAGRAEIEEEESEFLAALRAVYDREHSRFLDYLMNLRQTAATVKLIKKQLAAIHVAEQQDRQELQTDMLKTLRAITKASRRVEKEIAVNAEARRHEEEAAQHRAKEDAKEHAQWVQRMESVWLRQRLAIDVEESVNRNEYELSNDGFWFMIQSEIDDIQAQELFDFEEHQYVALLKASQVLTDEMWKERLGIDDEERMAWTALREDQTRNMIASSERQLVRELNAVQEQEARLREDREELLTAELLVRQAHLTQEFYESAPRVALVAEMNTLPSTAAAAQKERGFLIPFVDFNLQFVEQSEEQFERPKLVALEHLSRLFIHYIMSLGTTMASSQNVGDPDAACNCPKKGAAGLTPWASLWDAEHYDSLWKHIVLSGIDGDAWTKEDEPQVPLPRALKKKKSSRYKMSKSPSTSSRRLREQSTSARGYSTSVGSDLPLTPIAATIPDFYVSSMTPQSRQVSSVSPMASAMLPPLQSVSGVSTPNLSTECSTFNSNNTSRVALLPVPRLELERDDTPRQGPSGLAMRRKPLLNGSLPSLGAINAAIEDMDALLAHHHEIVVEDTNCTTPLSASVNKEEAVDAVFNNLMDDLEGADDADDEGFMANATILYLQHRRIHGEDLHATRHPRESAFESGRTTPNAVLTVTDLQLLDGSFADQPQRPSTSDKARPGTHGSSSIAAEFLASRLNSRLGSRGMLRSRQAADELLPVSPLHVSRPGTHGIPTPRKK